MQMLFASLIFKIHYPGGFHCCCPTMTEVDQSWSGKMIGAPKTQ